MQVDFETLASKLGWTEGVRALFAPHWENLMRDWSGTVPEHLSRSFYECRKAAFGLRSDLLRRVESVCRKLPDFPEVCFFGWAMPYLDFVLRVPERLPGDWHFPEKYFGKDTPVFFWMVKAGLIPILAEIYAQRGIPYDYAESYLLTLMGLSDIHAAGHDGIPGTGLGLPSWERRYAELKLFRIGRFAIEFCPYLWSLPIILRRRSDRRLEVFCRDGWELDAQGRMPCVKAPPDPGVRTVRLLEDSDKITGVPIDPYGHCRPEITRTLSRKEWEPVCSPWDLTANIHIPGGGGMTPDAIRASLLETVDFSRKYLHRDVALFCCHSWILNPAWERELPQSNLAAFQRECWLSPGDCYDVEGLGFVFGRSDGDRLAYPQTTSLHRAFHCLMQSGEKLRSGVGFLLPEHLPHYGTQYYRCRYDRV